MTEKDYIRINNENTAYMEREKKKEELKELKTESEAALAEVVRLESHLNDVTSALGVDSLDEIEEALESNSNLEARITELEAAYPPDSVFDAFRDLCWALLFSRECDTSTGKLIKRISEQSPSPIPDQVVKDGLRWMIDNDPRGTI